MKFSKLLLGEKMMKGDEIEKTKKDVLDLMSIAFLCSRSVIEFIEEQPSRTRFSLEHPSLKSLKRMTHSS